MQLKLEKYYKVCMVFFLTLSVLTFLPTEDKSVGVNNVLATGGQKIPIYRLYNPNSGEHLHTMNDNERVFLMNVGWKYEGISMLVSNEGQSLYRLYNPNSGEHFYTLNDNERKSLQNSGWRDEGIAWVTPWSGVPMYRMFNPKARDAGSHHYTVSIGERDLLIAYGWKYEGPSWNVLPMLLPSLPNDEYAWRFFRERGFSKEGTAGIIGNFMAESGLNPLAVEKGAVNGGRGIAQWGQCGTSSTGASTGCRWMSLEKWAREKNMNPNELQTQLEYTVKEMTDYKIIDYFKGSNPLYVPGVGPYGGGTVGYFAERFERPNIKYAHMDRRYQYAQNAFNKYGEI